MDEINNTTPQYQDEGEGIDLMAICAKILKRWKFIFVVSFIAGVIGIGAALMMKRTYGVTMTMAPESTKSSANGNLSNLASMVGVNLSQGGSGMDALNVRFFPEISKSTPFLAEFLGMEMTPYVSPKAALEGAVATPVSLYDHLLKRDKVSDKKKNSSKYIKKEEKYARLYNDSVLDIQHLTPRQAQAIKKLSSSISASVDQKTGMTTINVVMDDRRMVTDLADTVCAKLQEYIIRYRTEKAQADYEYYVKLADEAHEDLVIKQAAYAARVDYDRSVILQSVNSEKQRLQQEAELANQIYSQMAQQRELAKAKVQEEKPVYAVIQPATMPQKAQQSRTKTVLIFGFLGFFLSCLWAGFGEDFVRRMRSDVKQKIDEQ